MNKRQLIISRQAIFELIVTEGSYVRDLQLIVEVFYTNLLELLDQKATTVVFANIEDILLCNTVSMCDNIITLSNDATDLPQRTGRKAEGLSALHDLHWRYIANAHREYGRLYGIDCRSFGRTTELTECPALLRQSRDRH